MASNLSSSVDAGRTAIEGVWERVRRTASSSGAAIGVVAAGGDDGVDELLGVSDVPLQTGHMENN